MEVYNIESKNKIRDLLLTISSFSKEINRYWRYSEFSGNVDIPLLKDINTLNKNIKILRKKFIELNKEI